MWKPFGLVLAAGLVFGAGPEISPQLSARRVPSRLMTAAEGLPREFVVALIGASVPCGLEVREVNDEPGAPPPTRTETEQSVALSEAIAAFEQAHPDYGVVEKDGVLVVRPKSGASSYLDAASPIGAPAPVTGVMTAVRYVFKALNPLLFTGLRVGTVVDPGAAVRIVLDGSGRRSVLDTLNQIVLQAPSRAWFVTTREHDGNVQILSAGVLGADGYRIDVTVTHVSSRRDVRPPR